MNHFFKIICTAVLALVANTAAAATISINGTVELSPLHYHDLVSIGGRLNLPEHPVFQSGDDVHLKINFAGGKALRMMELPGPYFDWNFRHFSLSITKAESMPLGGWGSPEAKTSNVRAVFTGWRTLAPTPGKPLSMPLPGLSDVGAGLGVGVGSWVLNDGEAFEFTGIEASFHIDDLGVAPNFAEFVNVGALGFDTELFLVDATGGGDPAQVPEPGTAMLASIGLMGLATVLRRRRRK